MGRLVEESHRPFDLERGPVLRVNLFTRSAEQHVLLLTMHHIVVDFISFVIILDELRTLYAAEKAGVEALLPELAVQYLDYASWQAEMLEGPQGEKLWDYWRKQLAGDLTVLNLPTDRPRLQSQTFRGATQTFKLSEELTRRAQIIRAGGGGKPFHGSAGGTTDVAVSLDRPERDSDRLSANRNSQERFSECCRLLS